MRYPHGRASKSPGSTRFTVNTDLSVLPYSYLTSTIRYFCLITSRRHTSVHIDRSCSSHIVCSKTNLVQTMPQLEPRLDSIQTIISSHTAAQWYFDSGVSGLLQDWQTFYCINTCTVTLPAILPVTCRLLHLMSYKLRPTSTPCPKSDASLLISAPHLPTSVSTCSLHDTNINVANTPHIPHEERPAMHLVWV